MYVRRRVRSVPARNIAATETKSNPGAGGSKPAGSRKEADREQQKETVKRFRKAEVGHESTHYRRRRSRDQNCGEVKTGRPEHRSDCDHEGSGYFLCGMRASVLCGRIYREQGRTDREYAAEIFRTDRRGGSDRQRGGRSGRGEERGDG